MLYLDSSQQRLFEAARDRAQKQYASPIVTEILSLKDFYPAEQEHEDYYARNPEAAYCQTVIAPKLAKTRMSLTPWIKK